jgi:hypothetical protein
MMGGGGGITNWTIGKVAAEDEDEEGLESTERVIFDLVVGDKTSGVRGCKMVGSKMIPTTKLSDRVLTRFCWEKVPKLGF